MSERIFRKITVPFNFHRNFQSFWLNSKHTLSEFRFSLQHVFPNDNRFVLWQLPSEIVPITTNANNRQPITVQSKTSARCLARENMLRMLSAGKMSRVPTLENIKLEQRAGKRNNQQRVCCNWLSTLHKTIISNCLETSKRKGNSINWRLVLSRI